VIEGVHIPSSLSCPLSCALRKCVRKRGRVLRIREPFILLVESTGPCVCVRRGLSVLSKVQAHFFNPAEMSSSVPLSRGGEEREALRARGVQKIAG